MVGQFGKLGMCRHLECCGKTRATKLGKNWKACNYCTCAFSKGRRGWNRLHARNVLHLEQIIDSYTMIWIFQGGCLLDLCELHDLYDLSELARVAG